MAPEQARRSFLRCLLFCDQNARRCKYDREQRAGPGNVRPCSLKTETQLVCGSRTAAYQALRSGASKVLPQKRRNEVTRTALASWMVVTTSPGPGSHFGWLKRFRLPALKGHAFRRAGNRARTGRLQPLRGRRPSAPKGGSVAILPARLKAVPFQSRDATTPEPHWPCHCGM